MQRRRYYELVIFRVTRRTFNSVEFHLRATVGVIDTLPRWLPSLIKHSRGVWEIGNVRVAWLAGTGQRYRCSTDARENVSQVRCPCARLTLDSLPLLLLFRIVNGRYLLCEGVV